MSTELSTTSASLAPETSLTYHNDHTHLSASMLKVLAQSPQTYYQRFVTGTLKQEDTEAMRFGRAFHAMVLEPETFKDRFVVAPQCDRRTKAGKETWSEFQVSLVGKEVIDADWIPQLEAMGKQILSHPEARDLLTAEGPVEQVIRWEDKVFRKARPDKIVPDMGVILDLKTIDDPSPMGFASAAARFGYYIQDYWYPEAAANFYGEEFRMLFICVGKREPYEVGIYELKSDDQDWAEQRCEGLVDELIARKASGNWLAGWQQDINVVPLPKWLRSDFWKVEG